MVMRSKILEAVKNSLLQEVSIDMLKTQFVDSGQLSQEAFDDIVKASNGKSAYATWLAKMVEKNEPEKDKEDAKEEPNDERRREDERFAPALKQEDIYKFSSYFQLFEKHKNKFKFKDINQYKAGKAFNSNREALSSFIDSALEVQRQEVEKARKKAEISGGEEIDDKYVSPDDILKLEEAGIDYLGFMPSNNGSKYQGFKLTIEKAGNPETHKLYNSILMRCKDRHLGAKIELCTAPNYGQYINYLQRDDLFVFFNLNDPKSPIQMHYKDGQFMDKDDRSVIG